MGTFIFLISVATGRPGFLLYAGCLKESDED
jgi:hypothetical protein